MAKKYRITLTEEQARVTQDALDEYMRLRMGQDMDFCDDIAAIGVDFSPENPDHELIFDRFIHRRDALRQIMQSFFRVAWGYNGVKEKTEDGMIAECIWDAIRFHRGLSRWNEVFHIGSEPVPKIEVLYE